MADWVKLATNMFDNKKIKQIEVAPKGKQMLLLWVRLICLAGTINDGGRVYVTKGVPYTNKGLAVELNESVAVVDAAMKLFREYNMIDVDEEHGLYLVGWEKHQNIEGLEKIRDDAKIRQRRLRFRKVGLEYVGDEICAYCGAEAVTVDHIIPKSKGGSDLAKNAVPCCKSCNSAKGNKDLVDFLNTQLEYKAYVDIDAILANEKLNTLVTFDSVNNVFVNVSDDCNNVTSHVHSHSNHSPITPQNKNKNKNKNIENDNSLSNSLPIPIVQLYEQKIGLLNSMIAHQLGDLIIEYGDDRVKQGIEIACERGGRTLNYVRKCVENPIPAKPKTEYIDPFKAIFGDGGVSNGSN